MEHIVISTVGPVVMILLGIVAYFLRGILSQFATMNKTISEIDKKLELQVYRQGEVEKDLEALYSRVRELEKVQ